VENAYFIREVFMASQAKFSSKRGFILASVGSCCLCAVCFGAGLNMDEINRGAIKVHGNYWYLLGKFVYVPLAAILCAVALFKQIAF
jgi:SNF family Na+-dependent transporter